MLALFYIAIHQYSSVTRIDRNEGLSNLQMIIYSFINLYIYLYIYCKSSNFVDGFWALKWDVLKHFKVHLQTKDNRCFEKVLY